MTTCSWRFCPRRKMEISQASPTWIQFGYFTLCQPIYPSHFSRRGYPSARNIKTGIMFFSPPISFSWTLSRNKQGLETTQAPDTPSGRLASNDSKQGVISVNKQKYLPQHPTIRTGKTGMAKGPTDYCPLHKKPHPLSKCRAFRVNLLKERETFMKGNGICFKCCSSTTQSKILQSKHQIRRVKQ